MNPLRIIALLGALIFSCNQLQAADSGETPTSKTDAADRREQAHAHEEAGLKAMQESNNKPSLSVEAAMEFSAALKLYEGLEDFDKCREMNANIFWCKKKMNLEDLSSYVARKGEDKQTAENYEKILAVADKKVPVEEADAYFERAQKFATDNPDKHFQIAIRYFEVAERFVGSEVSLKAQKLSLAAQEEYLRTSAPKTVARETIFTRPPENAGSAQVPLPSPAERKDATTKLKALFKEEITASKKRKETLGHKYLDTAKEGKEDAVTRWVLLNHAQEIATQNDNFYDLIVAIDEMGRQFSGYDAAAEKKTALGKIKSQEAAAALLLIGDPANKDANTKAGKFICVVANQWDAGLPLLAIGSDDKLSKLAEMELQKPSGALQEMEIGDGWYDLGAKAQPSYKEGMWKRARLWYKKAAPGLPAVSKQKIDQRLEEIFALTPDPDADYNALTEAQWERLKAPKVDVNCAKPCDTGVVLKAGQKIRVVPHPTDTWTGMDLMTFDGASVSYTWKGAYDSPIANMMPGGKKMALPIMALACHLDAGEKQAPGLLTGPGKLILSCYDTFHTAQSGTIRVKLLVIDE